MFSLRRCMPLHTDFAEDLFEYPFKKPIRFDLKDNYFESETIDIQAIFDYCKQKYNYTNDDMHYFKYAHYVDKLEPFRIYYDVSSNKFIIPLETQEDIHDIVPFGMIKNDELINEMKNNKTLLFKV